MIDPKTVVVEATAANTERSPADVLRLVVATVALLVEIVVQWLFGDTLVAFASELLSGLEALPEWMASPSSWSAPGCWPSSSWEAGWWSPFSGDGGGCW